MIRLLPLPILLTALAVASLVAPAAAQAPKIGVVDMFAAIEQYPKFLKERKAIGERYSLLMAQEDELRRKLSSMRATLELVENARERADRKWEYDMALQRADRNAQVAREEIKLAEMRVMMAAFEDLDYAVAEVAKKKGLSLVLTREDIPLNPAPIDDQTDSDVQRRTVAYEGRKVLWAAAELDITGDVIKFMKVPLPDRNAPERAGPAPKSPDPKPAEAGSGGDGSGGENAEKRGG